MEFNKKAFTKNMPYMLLGISIIVLSIIVTIFLSKSNLENEVVDLNDKDIDINKLVISEVMSSNKGVHVDKDCLYEMDKDLKEKIGVVFDGNPAYFQDSNIVWIKNDESLVLNRYLYWLHILFA